MCYKMYDFECTCIDCMLMNWAINSLVINAPEEFVAFSFAPITWVDVEGSFQIIIYLPKKYKILLLKT